MPAFPRLAPYSARLRSLCALGAIGFVLALLAAGSANAQDWLSTRVGPEEIRRALIWTGHYSAFEDGDPNEMVTAAGQAWQKSKNRTVTKTLPDDQVEELINEGLKKRDATGWTTLEDKSIGFSIGVPTRLTKFVAAHPVSGAQIYEFEGAIGFTVAVRYGDANCMTMKSWYRFLLKGRPFFHAQRGNWMAFGEMDGDSRIYEHVMCKLSGAVFTAISIPGSLLAKYGSVFAAVGESVKLAQNFNPTATPRPRLEEPPVVADDFKTVSHETREPKAKPSGNADSDGKTDVIKRATRDGTELTVEQVFQKASPSVYVVRAGDRLGSAVAISEHELLTNCHVVAEAKHVSIARDKKEGAADVVSVNSKADRCVLKTDNKLETWVTVRPYDDIKVGERAVTIGTPQGLELTVAEGIVSSKRTHDDSKLIQTTAPISQGSSGGGLFDGEGHLLGITTFYLRSGQNLNFAVAAEEFAK
jgi:S1-C subfamily serine protease